jgi:hypothetical protein
MSLGRYYYFFHCFLFGTVISYWVELFDRKARTVAKPDGHDLLGHRSSLPMVGGSLD